MDMVKVLTFAMAAGLAAGADFSIQVGSPVAANAANAQKVKSSVMAVRTQDCADPAKARFTGTAVRMKGTNRETSALGFIEGSTPGSFAVLGGWAPYEGPWLAVISGECMGSKAGALIPVNGQGSYVREASRFFNHAPTDAEIETVMKTVMGGLR